MEFSPAELSKFIRANKLGITGSVPYVCEIDGSQHQSREAVLLRAHECLCLIGRDTSCRLTDAQNLYASQ